MVSNDPSIWYSQPSEIFSAWVWTSPVTLFFVLPIKYGKTGGRGDSTSMIRLLNTETSILWADSPYCLLGCLIWWNKLPSCRDLPDKEPRGHSGQEPTKNWCWGSESYQQPCGLGDRSSPRCVFRWDHRPDRHFDYTHSCTTSIVLNCLTRRLPLWHILSPYFTM